jgi:hypothetical protein
MITFHNDHLVPPELCQLVSLTVPREHHVPVVFFNRNSQLAPEKHKTLGTCCWSHITIHLHKIYADSRHAHASSMAAALWRGTLEVVWHEFGHIATAEVCQSIPHAAYTKGGREYLYIESLAEDYKNSVLTQVLERDKALAQPRVLKGYYGARILKVLKRLSSYDGSGKAAHVKELRCLKAGAQLTVGDMLSSTGFYPHKYPSAYRALRKLIPDVGVNYVDAAGRNHKLFHWGDVPTVKRRLELAEARGELVKRKVATHDPDGLPSLFELIEAAAAGAGLEHVPPTKLATFLERMQAQAHPKNEGRLDIDEEFPPDDGLPF